jgi:hypothetical protein
MSDFIGSGAFFGIMIVALLGLVGLYFYLKKQGTED